MDKQDNVTMLRNRLYEKRGIIKEFSDDSQRTLRRKIDELYQKEGRFLKVDLTTKTKNPKAATYRLKQWKDAMGYDYTFDGVHCLEFQPGTECCHFHMVIRLEGDRDIDEFRGDCFRRWQLQNPSVSSTAYMVKPLKTRDDLENRKEYLCKRHTKELPPALRETGLGCNWCGYFSRRSLKGRPYAANFRGQPLQEAA
jgi:hypothetical protein